MRIPIRCNPATTEIPVMLLLEFQIGHNTKANVHLVKISLVFDFVDKTAMCLDQSIGFFLERVGRRGKVSFPLKKRPIDWSTICLHYFCCKGAFGQTKRPFRPHSDNLPEVEHDCSKGFQNLVNMDLYEGVMYL